MRLEMDFHKFASICNVYTYYAVLVRGMALGLDSPTYTTLARIIHHPWNLPEPGDG